MENNQQNNSAGGGVPPYGPQPNYGPQPQGYGPGPQPGYGPPQPGYGPPQPGPGQPYPPQGYPQQPMVPKQPMDPETKKKIILFSCLGGGVLVLGIAALIILPAIFRVNYREAYVLAKELKPEVSKLEYSRNCKYAVDNLEDRYVDEETYNKYVNGCLEMGGELSDKLAALKESAGVAKDENVNKKFDEFMVKYNKAMGDREAVEKAMPIYKVWHEYWLAFRTNIGNSWTVDDSKIKATFKILADSGVPELVEFGTGAEEKFLAAAKAAREYDAASYAASNKTELRNKRDAMQKAYNDYVSESRPDVASLYPIGAEEGSGVGDAYETFYRALADAYAQNYNEGDGECTKLFEVVYCS